MRKTLVSCHIAVLGLLLFGSAALALPIQGSSTGAFTNPIGPAGMVTTGVGTSTFTWGNGSGFNSPPSSMNFSGASINTVTDTSFSFGTLTYYNGTIAAGTEANSVDLDVFLTLTQPSGINQVFAYTLSLINTANTTNPNASADYVVFPTSFPTSSFSFGGTNYTLAFEGFGSITAGGFSQVNQFHVLEGQSASAELIGRVTEHTGVVPEPGTMLLLGSGLLGLAGYGRKRNK